MSAGARRAVRLAWTLCLLPEAAGAGEPGACSNASQLVVASASAEQRAEVCAAATRALAFLGAYGLTLKRPVTLSVVDESVNVNGHAAYASYDSRNDAIRLMAYQAILERVPEPRMYDLPFDRNLYAGVIAHEIAHAAMHHHSAVARMFAPPQEYLAHATQLAVMPDAEREALIRRKRVAPWDKGDVVSDAYLAADAGKFAVKSYLHLTSRAEPVRLVRHLLAAQGFGFNVPNDAD